MSSGVGSVRRRITASVRFEGFQYVPVINKKTGHVEQTKGKKPQDKKRLEFVRENVCASIIRKRLQVEFGKYKVHKFASVFNGKNMQELIDRYLSAA